MLSSVTVVPSASFQSQASFAGSFSKGTVSELPSSMALRGPPSSVSYISVTPQASSTPASSPVKCHTVSTRVRYSAPRELVSSAREKARAILGYQAPEECVVLAFSSGDERTVTKGLLCRHSGLFAELIPQGERREARRRAEASARSERVLRLRQLAQREKMLAQEQEELRLVRQQESSISGVFPLRPLQGGDAAAAAAAAVAAETALLSSANALGAGELEEALLFCGPNGAVVETTNPEYQKNFYVSAAKEAAQRGVQQHSFPLISICALASTTTCGGQSSQQSSMFDMNLDAGPGIEGGAEERSGSRAEERREGGGDRGGCFGSGARTPSKAEDVKPLRLQLECTSEVFDVILAWMHLVDHPAGHHHSAQVALETLRGREESELLRLSLEADFLEIPALSGQIRVVIGERHHERRLEHEKKWRLRWVEKETDD